MHSRKEIYIFGGPNGAGKTTAARVIAPEFLRVYEYLNADEIAREISPCDPDAAAFAAGRRLIQRMRELVRAQQSFAFETTCAGRSFLRILEESRLDGWRVSLFYFWLPSPEDAIARVARRVKSGGHGIPVETVRRRYYSGVSNMIALYLPLADEAEIYDNSDKGRTLIAEKRAAAGLTVHDPGLWARLEEASRWSE